MTGSERAIAFACATETLRGVLAVPDTTPDIGVVIIVGGPQYRAGSHRQFVLLARSLAEAGYPVLRFDARGMGDSTGLPRDFESVSDDIGAAIDALLLHIPSVRHVVLWALCDGASAALMYLGETGDARVRGLCLANPWVRSERGLAKTHLKHYYARRLLSPAFWGKLLGGRLGWEAPAEFARKLRPNADVRAESASPPHRSFQQRMAAAWSEFGGEILLILSERDYTALEFIEHVRSDPAWRGSLTRPNVERIDLEGADHTFSLQSTRTRLESIVAAWIGRLAGAGPSAALADRGRTSPPQRISP